MFENGVPGTCWNIAHRDAISSRRILTGPIKREYHLQNLEGHPWQEEVALCFKHTSPLSVPMVEVLRRRPAPVVPTMLQGLLLNQLFCALSLQSRISRLINHNLLKATALFLSQLFSLIFLVLILLTMFTNSAFNHKPICIDTFFSSAFPPLIYPSSLKYLLILLK